MPKSKKDLKNYYVEIYAKTREYQIWAGNEAEAIKKAKETYRKQIMMNLSVGQVVGSF